MGDGEGRGGRGERRREIRIHRGATPEEHARTRCVISDCLPGFVDGWVISSGGGDRTKREKESGRGWAGRGGGEGGEGSGAERVDQVQP